MKYGFFLGGFKLGNPLNTAIRDQRLRHLDSSYWYRHSQKRGFRNSFLEGRGGGLERGVSL